MLMINQIKNVHVRRLCLVLFAPIGWLILFGCEVMQVLLYSADIKEFYYNVSELWKDYPISDD